MRSFPSGLGIGGVRSEMFAVFHPWNMAYLKTFLMHRTGLTLLSLYSHLHFLKNCYTFS